VLALRLLGGAGSAALGWLGADQVTSSGPDLAGIALLITAISGLIATIGGLFLGLRKRPSSDATDLLLAAMAERMLKEEGQSDDTTS
jgi:hypothetical protein